MIRYNFIVKNGVDIEIYNSIYLTNEKDETRALIEWLKNENIIINSEDTIKIELV